MIPTKRYNINRLRDYSSLFSRSSLREWMNGDLSSIDSKIERYDSKWLLGRDRRYIDYLKFVYSTLENHYQNEYILKNSFLNEWLIKELGDGDSQVFNEFRVGTAVADLTMFNGNSKVFEIKTELDSDKRLSSQLEQYKKVFNQIFLIVPISKVHLYENYDKNVGIITYSKNITLDFNLLRQAESNNSIDSNTLMQIFHSNEYKEIVKKYFGYLPKMTSFSQYQICYEMISQIHVVDLNRIFIEQMKLRNNSISLSNRHYKEFNQLRLAFKMDSKSCKQMFDVLRSPLNS